MEDLVHNTNRLLASVGISDRPFTSATEVADNSSSMLVAVFEAVFATRIADVKRKPTSQSDYAVNAQRVVDSLRAILPPRVVIPESVTGDAIAGGDLPAITFLVSLLADVDRVIRRPGSLGKASPAKHVRAADVEVSEDAAAAAAAEAEDFDAAAVTAALEASSIGSAEDNAHVVARGAAQRMFALSGVEAVPTTTAAAAALLGGSSSSSSSSSSSDAAQQQMSSTGRSADIWSGQSPEKVRKQAEKAGLAPTAAPAAASKGAKGAPTSAAAPPSAPPAAATAAAAKRAAAPGTPSATASARKATAATAGTAAAPLSSTLSSTAKPGSTAAPRTPRSVQPPKLPASVAAKAAAAAANDPTHGAENDDEGGAAGQHQHHHHHHHHHSHSNKHGSADADAFAEMERKHQETASAMAMRRQQGAMARLLHKNQEELQNIQTMMDAAVKAREADFRVLEAKAIRSATARAKAAKHERKVLSLRTRQTLEDLARHTLALRIARSSRQASAAASLLKALAAQERLAAADKLRVAADERDRDVMGAQGKLSWAQQQATLVNELVLEETAKQVAQRQAAAKSQREALNRAVREMRADEQALMQRMKDEQSHAEAAFLAQHVEPMEPGGRAGPLDGPRVARERIADETDTDNDPLRVYTMQRTHAALVGADAARAHNVHAVQSRIHSAAVDVAEATEEAAAMTAAAQKEVDAAAGTLRAVQSQLKGTKGGKGGSLSMRG
jgi:hypothetical protein